MTREPGARPPKSPKPLPKKPRLNWSKPGKPNYLPAICNRIIRGFTSRPTLRQLFYQLVSHFGLANNKSAYDKLSHESAEWRRQGRMDDLIDQTRNIYDYESWDSMADALKDRVAEFRLDRDATQDRLYLIAVEKNGMRAAFIDSFMDPYGIPVLPLGGYASQTYKDRVTRYIRRERRGRECIILYAGDCDPHGFAIEADFRRRISGARVVRVALTREQADTMGPGGGPLPRSVGNASSDQVEIDALDPDVLADLMTQALLDHGFDFDKAEAIVELEDEARAAIQEALLRIVGGEENR